MSTPLYAAITLGSNSFNMLVAQKQGDQDVVVAKYKRKVRLAEGIEADGHLNGEVMQRGLDCLAMFAEMLQKEGVQSEYVAVIATATLRNIANAAEFCERALTILGHEIEIISGLKEAEYIYRGMAATTPGAAQRLVIDIGGASTEFIIGQADEALFKTSLKMGSVTFTQRFFEQRPYQLSQFDDAAAEVELILADNRQLLLQTGWQGVVGASGAVQSVLEVLAARNLFSQDQTHEIALQNLYQLRQEILKSQMTDLSDIEGLSTERAPTFAGGVAILVALFELLDIESLQLSGGALREGVLQMLRQRLPQ